MGKNGNQGFSENSRVTNNGELMPVQSVKPSDELKRVKRELKAIRIAYEESELRNTKLRVELTSAEAQHQADQATIKLLGEKLEISENLLDECSVQ